MAASRTALIAAALRMTHRSDDDAPPVLDDPLAERLLGAEAPELAALVRSLPERTLLGLRSSVVGRSRVVDDRVRARSVSGPARYVAVGAGLDTLAGATPISSLRWWRSINPTAPPTSSSG